MTRHSVWRNVHILVHVVAAVPLLLTAYEYLTGTLPIVLDRHLVIRFGAVGMAFLVASFSITPIGILSGKTNLKPIRRPLGVYGFCYMALHILAYAWLSNGFDWGLILRDIGERRAMSVGLLAFTLLIPLALTSTNGWQRRLGRRWKALHRLVYFAVPLSILHYFWLERDIKDWVLVYAALVAILFVVRLPDIRRAIARRRQSPQMIASETKTKVDS
ncbi:MAG TPA: protein-methionine-sulfoxide reductase heme-binding subunit MsrQ [Anaerolineales bacterium]|nr:protein-methionine-sulfoxide reductase heme-binding subunit MsrQ [Anaerolineales bacterium]